MRGKKAQGKVSQPAQAEAPQEKKRRGPSQNGYIIARVVHGEAKLSSIEESKRPVYPTIGKARKRYADMLEFGINLTGWTILRVREMSLTGDDSPPAASTALTAAGLNGPVTSMAS